MRFSRKAIAITLPLMIALSAPAMAQDMPGGMGGMGGGDMGGGGPGSGGQRPPQPPKPVKRARFDKLVTDMFRAADTNRDGTVTIAELHALFETRRAAIIRDRFAKIDTDRSGSISMEEFAAWQRQMGSVASQDGGAMGDRDGPVSEAVMPDPGNDEQDRMVAQVIEPLTGTVIAKANTNYDGGVSLEELLAYEGKLFDASDTDNDGYLSMEELRPKGRNGIGGPNGPSGNPGPRPDRPMRP